MGVKSPPGWFGVAPVARGDGAEPYYLEMLVCPVRGCGLPLVREERRLVCGRSHSFDVARSGYANLLQPQDKRSKHPGDTVEAVAARRRLHELQVTRPLLDAIGEMMGASMEDVVLDAGCGDGFYLGELAARAGFDAHGVDISIPAIDAAARKYTGDRIPGCEWIVANADRFIPYVDGAFSVVMSITARMNAGEFRRVIREGGRLLVAIPAPDDLIELRGRGRERVQRTLETFVDAFELTQRERIATTAHLPADAVHDVLHAIYRPLQSKPVEATRVTFALDLLLFRVKKLPAHD